MSDSYRIETLANGTQVARIYCGKCGGSGYLAGFEFIDNGRCWSCMGHRGPIGQISVDAYHKRQARNAKARARRQAAREARVEAKLAEQRAQAQAFAAEHASFVALLNGYRGANEFVLEAKADLAVRPLTERRVEAVSEAIAREADVQPVPEGRAQVTGTITSIKLVETVYGAIYKMLVDCGGYRVYGTLPKSLAEADKGDQVTFVAKLERGRETGFGFFSRPTKAHLVKQVQAAS